MSCEQERYINEEAIIRKTWGKNILDKKYDNVELYFYRGGSEKNFIDEENHIIYLNSGDDLDETGQKTSDCFSLLKEKEIEYDYIVRTNTSTYINIDAILQFLELDFSDNIVCGPCLKINNSNKNIPFLAGYFLIIPHKIVDILSQYKLKGPDDSAIAMALYNKFKNEYIEKYILEVDSIRNMNKQFFNDLSKAYCIRVKDELNYENNIINMIGLHVLFQTVVKTKINPPHKFTTIETIYGQIPI